MSAVEDTKQRLSDARAELLRSARVLAEKPAPTFMERLSQKSFERHVEALEHELYLVEAESRREVIEWHLEGARVRNGSIPLRLLARLSEHFNQAVTKGAWRLRQAIDIPRIPADFYEFLDLRLADVRSGSSRIIFTGSTAPDLAGTSLLADTLHRSFELLKADAKGVAEPVAALGLKATHKYAEWLKTLQDSGVSAELLWSDDQHVPHQWAGLPSDMARVRDRLASLSESPPMYKMLSGEVVTLADTGRIQIRVGSTKKATIRYPRKLFGQAQQLRLGQFVQLPVVHTRLINGETGKSVDRFALRAPETPPELPDNAEPDALKDGE